MLLELVLAVLVPFAQEVVSLSVLVLLLFLEPSLEAE